MGKKRALSIRRIVNILSTHYPNGFTSDFEENKRIISELMPIPSKTLRNKVAGYMTHYTRSIASERANLEENGNEEE